MVFAESQTESPASNASSLKSKYDKVNSFIGSVLWRSKRKSSKHEDSSFYTEEILKNEDFLTLCANEMKQFKDKIDYSKGLLHSTLKEFSNLLQMFTGLSKSVADFDEEVTPEDIKGKSVYSVLKKLFDFTSENFEQLVLQYQNLIHISESMFGDMSEAIDIIDSFLRNKGSIVDKLANNRVD